MNTIQFENNKNINKVAHIIIATLLLVNKYLVFLITVDALFTLIPLLTSLVIIGFLLSYIQSNYIEEVDNRWIYIHMILLFFSYPGIGYLVIIYSLLKSISLSESKVILLYNYLLVVGYYTLYNPSSWDELASTFCLINLLFLQLLNKKSVYLTLILLILFSPLIYEFVILPKYFGEDTLLFVSIYVVSYISVLILSKTKLSSFIWLIIIFLVLLVFYSHAISTISINFNSNNELIILLITFISISLILTMYYFIKTLMSIVIIKFSNESKIDNYEFDDLISFSFYFEFIRQYEKIYRMVHHILLRIYIRNKWVQTKGFFLSI